MLGTYRVEQKLAEGGMGSVFLASAPDGRKVVLKVPHAQDRDAAVALADEARTGARLRHPAIIETLDFFVDKGISVLVVAHIDGRSLFDLRRAGPLPGSAVAEIGVQLAGALHAIHTACDEAGRPLCMLHRDISPNNVLVDRSGQVRLIDLGIARSIDRRQKATLAGMVKGTLRYLAPEILRGGDHDVATDLWALGLTLWEAAMGRYAVAGDPMNTMRAAMSGDILALGDGERIDPDVLDVIKALVCPADERIQNAKAAANVLTRLTNKRPGGRDALAEAVAVVAAALFEDERTDNIDTTVTKERGGLTAPPSRAESPDVTAVLPREEDVAGVFTTTTPRDQMTAHAPARAAAAGPPPVTSVLSAEEGDAVSVNAASAARPITQPSARPSPVVARGVDASGLTNGRMSEAPTLLAMPAAQPVSAIGPTMVHLPAAKVGPAVHGALSLSSAQSIHTAPTLQMPAVAVAPAAVPSELDPRGTEPPPVKARTEEEMETMATIQMPQWAEPSDAARARAQPKGSLFLPAVVVDSEDEDEGR